MGGKADSLQRLQDAGFPVPPFFTIGPNDVLNERRLRRMCANLARAGHAASFAVRSSAQAEDGRDNSYAGMFETFLFVPSEVVADRIRRVRACAGAHRVRIYDAVRDLQNDHATWAIVQVMVDADAAGVAFSRDPVSGNDCSVISAAYGLGSGVVGGECDADLFRVSAGGEILERNIARKTTAHRRGKTLEGVCAVPVPDALIDVPALSDANVRRVAALVRAIAARFGAAQDIEWALCGETLYVLQARPITTAQPVIWDNSNIAESYGGLVSPLTFSFATHAYAGAYRQLMNIFGIDRRTIDAHEPLLHELLGLAGGRMYYNLLNWYRMLALVPGFALNRQFMESMMGVREALPAQVVAELERKGKTRDLAAMVKMLGALLYRYARLNGDVRQFHEHIDNTLAASPVLQGLRIDELHAEFERLETALLHDWEAPMVNDFFAMVFYGVLRALTKRWCGDDDGSLHNDLLCAAGGMVSAEPARLLVEMASQIRGDKALAAALSQADASVAVEKLRAKPGAFATYQTYLERFGDRCPNELKLESPSLHEDPTPLLRAVSALAMQPARCTGAGALMTRREAEKRVSRAVRARPLRSVLFAFVVKQTRARLRDRENLRLERTRVFARVREIMREIGVRLHEREVLADSRDIFFLELGELRSPDAARIVADRKRAYAEYAALPAPPDRFACLEGEDFVPRAQRPDDGDASVRSGIGCCPGVVRGRVRLVKDACERLRNGEILVAERTDPGWVVLFPAAAGILVERGSVLSHAAIVSREMGIPSVVGIAGLTQWLREGDLVEFDGRSGIVRRLESAQIRNLTDASAPVATVCSEHE